MFIRRRLALEAQTKALRLANEGHFTGEVMESPADPFLVMNMTLLSHYSWSSETGSVHAEWGPGLENRTPFEEHLKKIAKHKIALQEMKSSQSGSALVRSILTEVAKGKELTARVLKADFEKIDWKLLATFATPLNLKYDGWRHYAGSLHGEASIEPLVELQFISSDQFVPLH